MKTVRNRSQYFQLFRNKLVVKDLFKLELAYDLTKYSHGYLDQVRDQGERYFNHPRAVSVIVAEELNIFDADIHIATLMHDCPEDTHLMSFDRIKFIFGTQVAQNVLVVTKMNNQNMIKDAYLELYFKNIQKQGWRACIIKCADRIHNLRTLATDTEKAVSKVKKQITETQKYFPSLVPVISRYNKELAAKVEMLLHKEVIRLEKKLATLS